MGNSSCVIHTDFPRKAEPLSVNVPCRPVIWLSLKAFVDFWFVLGCLCPILSPPGDRGSQLSHSDLRVGPQLCHDRLCGAGQVPSLLGTSVFSSVEMGIIKPPAQSGREDYMKRPYGAWLGAEDESERACPHPLFQTSSSGILHALTQGPGKDLTV